MPFAPRARLSIGLGLLVLALTGNALITSRNLRTLAVNNGRVGRTAAVVERLGATFSTLQDAETGQRGYLLTGDPAYLAPYERAVNQVGGHLDALRRAAAGDPAAAAAFGALEAGARAKLAELKWTVDLRASGDTEGALRVVRTDEGIARMDAIRQVVAGWTARERRRLLDQERESRASLATATAAFVAATVLCLVLTAWLYALARRDLAAQEREARASAEANARVEAILESITDAFEAFDADWRFTYVNAAAERVIGKSRSELLGRSLWEVYPGLVGTSVEREFRRAVAEQVSVGFENDYEPWDRWFDVKAYPSRGGGLSVYFRDMTERKRADEAARLAEERLRLAVESAEVGTWDLDVATGRLVWDDRVREHFGLPPGAPVDYPTFLAGLHPDDRDRVDGQVRQALDPSGDADYNTEFRTVGLADGRERWVAARGKALFHDGRAVRFLGTTLDITARRRAEEALRQADRRKDVFLAVLSHEIRNPLAAARSALQILRRGPSPDDAAWAVDVLDRQTAQLCRLVDDLLDVSRISQGKVRLRRERCDLAALVRSACEGVRPLVDEHRHRLECSTDPGPMPLDADPARVEQVLTNLLTNAAKYTPEGGEIAVETRREGSVYAVSVRDNGVGIPPGMVDRVFDLFTQVDRAVDRAEGGLGIGLTVVRRLVEMHGGTIAASSPGPGLGSTFTVRLPAAPEGAPAEAADRAPAHPQAPPPRRRGRRVLVVDDNVDSARAVARLLRLDGHDVTTRHDGPSALDAARAQHPEVVLLDIGLPGMDGYEVARRLRGEEAGRGPVIVALSGYGQESDRQRSREAGFDHHLVKPVDYDALADLLDRAGNGSDRAAAEGG